MTQVTFQNLLEIWESEKNRLSAPDRIHPQFTLLQRLARGEDVPQRAKWFGHLAQCPACRKQWAGLMAGATGEDAAQPYLDVALPKVAAGRDNLEDVLRVPTRSGKFMLTLRKNLEAPDSCLVSLNVLDGDPNLEGRKVAVRDRNGRRLLEGRVLQGEVSGWLKGLDNIDLSITTVIPGD